MPEETATPLYVIKALAEVRDSALTNMLDRDAVEMLVTDQRAAEWIGKAADSQYMTALNDMGAAESENFMPQNDAQAAKESERIAALEETGRKLSVSQSWDGYNILVIAKAALTDANFHREALVITEMMHALDVLDEPHYTLSVRNSE